MHCKSSHSIALGIALLSLTIALLLAPSTVSSTPDSPPPPPEDTESSVDTEDQDDTHPADDHHGPPDEPDVPISHAHYDSDGHHDDEYDHEAIAGSKSAAEEFKELPPEESKRRLGLLINQMDGNKDGILEKSELVTWISDSLLKLDAEEAKNAFEENDENDDKNVTWKEFIHKTYGYTEKELREIENSTSTELKDFLRLIKEERIRFQLADANNDGSLSVEEYPAFVHPHNYKHMYPYELTRVLTDYDKNFDGFVDQNEFINQSKVGPELIEAEKKHFEGYDKDKNGKLDKQEIEPWAMPGFTKTAELEADHLIKETDADKDGKLSKTEILEQSSLWVGSQATDFGRHLHEMEQKKEL